MVQLADGQDDNISGDDGDGGADAQANQPLVPPAAPSSSSSSAARQAQLAQLKELQAKLDEQRQQTQELRTALEQQHTARGAHAQMAGRVARERILADDNVDKSLELKTAGEKLVAVAYLLQAMPEPSTPSGRNLRREAQELIEQAGPRGFSAHTTSREGQSSRSARCEGTLGARAHRESSRKGANP